LIPMYGDDINNRANKYLYNSIGKCFSYVMHQYYTWSSRTIINFVMYYLETKPVFVFAIVTALLFWLLNYSISEIFNVKNNIKMNILILLFMYCLPYYELFTAGWIATTSTYFFPFVLGMYCLIYLYRGEKMHKANFPFMFIATLYAANNEQMLVFLFVIFIWKILIMIFNRQKVHVFVYIQVIELVCSLVWMLLCPGNKVRNLVDTRHYFKGFNNLSIFNKIDIIAMTTGQHFMYGLILNILLLFTVISIYQFFKGKKEGLRLNIQFLVSIATEAVIILCSILYLYHRLYNRFNRLFFFPKNGLLYSTQPLIFVILLIMINVFLVVMTYYNVSVFRPFYRNMDLYIILTAGLFSRLVIMQSATQYASSTRTFFIFECSIIIISFLICMDSIQINFALNVEFICVFVVALANIYILMFVMCLNNYDLMLRYLRLWIGIFNN
ncbi:DUF6056 family protein, partial [Limosilactobacillus coleohominis]